jgi:hypothetical protein
MFGQSSASQKALNERSAAVMEVVDDRSLLAQTTDRVSSVKGQLQRFREVLGP